MGSPCDLHLYGADVRCIEDAADAARAEVERLEAKYSRYRSDSVLSQINAGAGGPALRLDDETAGLLEFACKAHAESGGLFDPSAGILRRAWDFNTVRLPDPAAITRLLPAIGLQRLHWEPPQLRLPAGMELDFGGFVKEYAADAAVAALRRAGLRHGLVNLGGDVSILGPHPDGRPWQVGIRHPRAPDTAIAQWPMHAGALASSGDYERYFIVDGRRYCHILNPHSGWPAQGFASVSVMAPQCLVAGVLSTTAMLMAPVPAMAWLTQMGLPYLAVSETGELRRGPGQARAAGCA